MKAIKLSLVALATLFSFGIASAQFGIQAGYSSEAQTSNMAKTNTINGFHVGPVYEMNVQGPVGLTYGLLYNYLTGKVNGTDTKIVAHRLDLPVRLQLGFPVSNGVSVIGFAGPNFSLGLGQKVGDVNIADLKMADGKKMFSPFDLQLGVGLGVKFNALTVKAGYDWGMLDRNNMDAVTNKGNDLKVGLSYSF